MIPLPCPNRQGRERTVAGLISIDEYSSKKKSHAAKEPYARNR